VSLLRKIAAVGVAPLVLMVIAGPADAHGAMTSPISRAAACGPEGGQSARSKACQAARAASDANALREWDNLRVPDVNGRDRTMIPDGKLCSGGLDAYRGLDLPRPDWPATRLTSGARFTFAYRATIPHQGAFRLFVTRSGYNPKRRLTWSDLEPRPFAAVTDPPMRNGSYVIKGRLPRGKSGHHVIFTIWQTSSTPDTYYSCSDVVFSGRSSGAGGGGAPAARTTAKDNAPVSPPTPQGNDTGASSPAGGGPGAANDGKVNAANESSSTLPLIGGGSAIVLALAGGAALLLSQRRRRQANQRLAAPGRAHDGR
jgi:chitin-binding protein